MSEILFASAGYSKYNANDTLPEKFRRMLDEMNFDETVKKKWVAIKMHLGRGVGYSTIHPLFVKMLVERLKRAEARVFITDQSVSGAANRGYTQEFLGCPIIPVCGQMGKYFYPNKIGYKTLKNIDIGGHIHDADIMIDLVHAKGHGACGFAGSCKNIAMGCVTDRTRGQIHGLEGGLVWDEAKCTHCDLCIESCNHNANSFKNGKYSVFYHDCTKCQHCVKVCPSGALTLDAAAYDEFQKGMALCTQEVLNTFPKEGVFYISFLTDITAVCDCWGFTTPSLVPDIGILASKDIVAIEKCSVDMIRIEDLLQSGLPAGTILEGEGHLFERLHGKNPFVQIIELEKLGLGTQEYTIREII